MNNEMYERINLSFNLDEISKVICEQYKLGAFVSNKLIEVGYEDFNYVLTTSKGKYCIKIFNKDRTDKDVSNYIDRINLSNKLNINTPKAYKVNDNILQTLNINDNTFKICVFEFIKGNSFYELNEVPSINEIKELIRQMTIIHSAKLDSEFIYDKWTITNFIKEYNDKKQYIDKKYIDLFNSLVERLSKVEFNKLECCFVHGDIISSNVMKDHDNKLWIIDFAVSNFLPRIVDLAVTSCNLCLVPNDRNKTIENIRIILDEYQKYSKLTDYELECFKLFYEIGNAMGILQISYLNNTGESSDEDMYWLNISDKGLEYCDDEFWNSIISKNSKSNRF